jgi:hypothetical protein
MEETAVKRSYCPYHWKIPEDKNNDGGKLQGTCILCGCRKMFKTRFNAGAVYAKSQKRMEMEALV